MSEQYLNKSPAQLGQDKIAWAKRSMPVLEQFGARLSASGIFKDKTIGVAMVLDAKSANLILTLQQLGANTCVYLAKDCGTNDCVAALKSNGINLIDGRDKFEQEKLDFILDDVDFFAARAQNGELSTPVINLSDSQLKTVFNDHYGIGQTAVMSMLDVTNLQIAGRHVMVTSYEGIGKGIAYHASAMGALVSVIENDPIKALQAKFDGYQVRDFKEACGIADVIFASTNMLTSKDIEFVKDGVFLCSTTPKVELPASYLNEVCAVKEIRNFVNEYKLPADKRVLIIGNGAPIQNVAGNGSSIEIADLVMTLYLEASKEFLNRKHDSETGIYGISLAAEEAIAIERLNSDN